MSEYFIKSEGGALGIARKLAACAAIALLPAACAKPLPADRSAYAGDWQAPDMRLVITAGGEVHYARRKGGANTTIDAPLAAFEGDDFTVGIGPLTTRFVVTRPPHLEGNVWKMTVDGVELTRGGTSADASA